ncbi:MAG: hypothetical protein HY902_19255, partial [Deltaproteobacteria bacterium]|nr:hypothetical protein [Deltaproteobacteria bacterium]
THEPSHTPVPIHADGKVPEGCQTLAEDWDCLTPWPSDWYRQSDGYLRLPAAAAPKHAGGGGKGEALDFFGMFPQDGAPILPQLAVHLPGGVDPADLLAPYDGQNLRADYSPSQKPTSTTLLLDADSGEAIPHIAEVDARPAVAAERLLMLRPLNVLKPGHRYVVALRKGLKDLTGKAHTAPAVFAALRDKTALAKAEPLRGHWEAQIFPVLSKFGVKRADLLLAWDVTTRSEAVATGDLLAVRSQALQALETMALDATVTQVYENPRPDLARRVEGVLTVPNFMASDNPGTQVVRDANGKPLQKGTTKAVFSLLIPPSVWSGKFPGPVRVIQFGHGFFGTQAEAYEGFLPALLDEYGIVAMAVDWVGMSKPDAGQLVTDLILSPNQGARFIERTYQGLINQLSLTWAAKHGLWQLPQARPGAASLADPEQVYFYGISMGHILGGTELAINPWLDRAVLSNGGASFGLMMSRAAPFGPFLGILENAAGSQDGAARLALLLHGPLERIDPVSYAGHVVSDTYPGSPATRKILMHCGMADTSVPNLATHLHARLLGLPLLQPSPRQLFGLAQVAAPAPAALNEFDLKTPPLDLLAQPAEVENFVHNTQRALGASKKQVDLFLRKDGTAQHTCDGVCDPE